MSWNRNGCEIRLKNGRQDKGVGTQISVSACFNATYEEPSAFSWVLLGSTIFSRLVSIVRCTVRRSNQHPKRASRSGRSRSGRPDQNGQPSPIRPDPYDRDRLGRTGSGHAREPSINSQLARRLAGFKGRSSAASKARKAGRGTGQGTGFDRLQRVVVKVHVSRHRPGNHIGHELGVSGGQFFGIKDGGGTGGSVPSWLPDSLEFQGWVVAS